MPLAIRSVRTETGLRFRTVGWLLLVGFLLMIVMGVATWMFPRPGKDESHYQPALAEVVYWIMAVATALRAAAEIASTLWPSSLFRLAIAAGGLGQLAGTALFVLHRLPRAQRHAALTRDGLTGWWPDLPRRALAISMTGIIAERRRAS